MAGNKGNERMQAGDEDKDQFVEDQVHTTRTGSTRTGSSTT